MCLPPGRWHGARRRREEEGRARGGRRGPPETQRSLRSKACQPQPWPSQASNSGGSEKTPCCPCPWTPSLVIKEGSGEQMRPQPTTIDLPPSFCQFPLLFPMWSSLAPEPCRGRKCLDPSSASCPSISKSLSKAQEPIMSSNPSSALLRSWDDHKLPLEAPTIPYSVRDAVRKDAVTGMMQRWSFSRSYKTGVGVPMGLPLAMYVILGSSLSLSGLRVVILEKKRIGSAGPEGKPGLWTDIISNPAWTHTHPPTHTSYTHGHTSQATWWPPPASLQPSFPYINSPCPPVSPAITYLILGY